MARAGSPPAIRAWQLQKTSPSYAGKHTCYISLDVTNTRAARARASGPLSGGLCQRRRCTQRQVQTVQYLHWVIEEAVRDGAPLYLAYLDFENSFN